MNTIKKGNLMVKKNYQKAITMKLVNYKLPYVTKPLIP